MVSEPACQALLCRVQAVSAVLNLPDGQCVAGVQAV